MRARRALRRELPRPLPVGADEREMLERVARFYVQTLKESPQIERVGLG